MNTSMDSGGGHSDPIRRLPSFAHGMSRRLLPIRSLLGRGEIMNQTTINVHTRFQIAPVDPRLFGGFLEHLGRAVYEGVFEPGSTHADADGYRSDVLEALRPLNMTAMRYPGGNFVSGYHWQDGVGPR